MFSEHVCQSCQGSTSHRSCKRAASVQCSACTRARLDYQKLEHGKWDICGAYPWPDLPEGRVLLVALPPLSHAYGHSSCGDAHGGHKCTQRDGHLCATPCAGALCFFLLGLACRLAAKVNGLSHFYLSEFAIVILSAQHCCARRPARGCAGRPARSAPPPCGSSRGLPRAPMAACSARRPVHPLQNHGAHSMTTWHS